ncbi:SDR family oxidoreductase [Limnobacter humi]|uniref:SDR family oxidoreductase n=1 Tax=Limnobacter humi TaxID=1778671 RepID=A0ABT1WF90_9BURK|nr:SDR family oxidoreductase [Limnobacter humi]
MKSLQDLFNLNGQVALITGATRGIGLACAELLAAHGATVIISSRKADSCAAVAQTLTDKGFKAVPMACHLGEMAEIEALWKQIEQQFGRLDILVNNGATNPHFGPIFDTDLSAFQKTVDVNIRGYFYMSSLGYKLMAKHGGGSIINVASVNGVIPGLYQGIYSITKAAVISMTKAFAKECAPAKVRVNAILPGATDTKFASALVNNDAIRNALLQHVPMNRIAQPSEMAGTVLYLASEASTYTTGACINVDGGYLVA